MLRTATMLAGVALLAVLACGAHAYDEEMAVASDALQGAGIDYVRRSLDKVIVYDDDGNADTIHMPLHSGTSYLHVESCDGEHECEHRKLRRTSD